MAEDSPHAPDLEALARSRFGELSEAEQRLLRAAPMGEIAYCGPTEDNSDPANDPANADGWGGEREIRAELIRWLCVDPEAAQKIDPRGLHAYAGKIIGKLNISYATVAFPLRFERCCLTDDAILRCVRIPVLNLAGSGTRSLDADGANVTGEVRLSAGFSANGEVRLQGAQVGGILQCGGGKFKNPGGSALSADRIKVAGSVFLRKGFSAEGEVRLLGAQIGGNLECDGSAFKNPGGKTLNADRVRVEGYVFLRKATSEGEVKLLNAQVGSNLECDDGRFKNPGGTALSAERIKVAGSVFLRKGFSAEGEVQLLGAEIDNNLDCDGGAFKNPSGDALSADNARVKGDFFLRGEFSAEGKVRLLGAQIGGNFECNGGVFKNPGHETLHADGINVTGDVFLRNGTFEGEVRLPGSRIGGDLDCDSGTFVNSDHETLRADGIRVSGDVFLRNGTFEGEVRLLGGQIGGSLECDGGEFKNPGGDALDADGVNVVGDVFLRKETFEGKVRLPGARIGGNLECDGGVFKNPGGNALTAENAKVEGDVFLRSGFRGEGKVVLFGVQIGGGLSCRRGMFSTLDLRTAIVKGIFNWSKIQGVNATRLDLRDASASAVLDEEPSWPDKGNLSLSGFTYSRISGGPTDAEARLKWLDRADRFTLQPYRQLAKVLHETGDERGARRVLFEMEHRRRKQQDRDSLARSWSWLLRWTIGYGQMSWRALLWLLGLSFVGCMISGFGYLGGAMTPNDEKAFAVFEQRGYPPDYYPQFNPLVYSFEDSFPLVNLGVKDHWAPSQEGSPKLPVLHCFSLHWMRDVTLRGVHPFRWNAPVFLRVWSWLQVPLGWGLATLFVAGLTGIVKSG